MNVWAEPAQLKVLSFPDGLIQFFHFSFLIHCWRGKPFSPHRSSWKAPTTAEKSNFPFLPVILVPAMQTSAPAVPPPPPQGLDPLQRHPCHRRWWDATDADRHGLNFLWPGWSVWTQGSMAPGINMAFSWSWLNSETWKETPGPALLRLPWASET